MFNAIGKKVDAV